MPRPKMIKRCFVVMHKNACILFKESYFLHGFYGFFFHRPVYDGFRYTEISDIILFPVYGHYSRICGYYRLVEEVFFQFPYAFFCIFREFPAKAVNAPIRQPKPAPAGSIQERCYPVV